MTKAKQIGLITSGLLLMAGNAIAAQPIAGYSAPAIDFVSTAQTDFSDEFSDALYSDTWQSFMTQYPATGPGTVSQIGDGVITLDTGVTPVGLIGGSVGIISHDFFANQSFTFQARITIAPDVQGTYCVIVGVGDYTVDAASFGVCNDADNVPFQASRLWASSGMSFEAYSGFPMTPGSVITLNVSYDASTNIVNASIPELSATVLSVSGFTMPNTSRVLVAAHNEATNGLPETVISRSKIFVDSVFTTLDIAGQEYYAATLAPFEENGILYDDGAGGPSVTLFFDGTPVLIASDGTQIPADGTTNYSIALVTLSTSEKLTLITPLSAATLGAISGIASVDGYIQDYYLAHGYGADYTINSGPASCGVSSALIASLQSLIASIPNGFSHPKYNDLLNSLANGDCAGALQAINPLRNYVNAKSGKTIPAVTAVQIVNVLNQIEAQLQ